MHDPYSKCTRLNPTLVFCVLYSIQKMLAISTTFARRLLIMRCFASVTFANTLRRTKGIFCRNLALCILHDRFWFSVGPQPSLLRSVSLLRPSRTGWVRFDTYNNSTQYRHGPLTIKIHTLECSVRLVLSSLYYLGRKCIGVHYHVSTFGANVYRGDLCRSSRYFWILSKRSTAVTPHPNALR